MKLPDIIKSKQQCVFKDIHKKCFRNLEAIYMIVRNTNITECIFENVSWGNCDFICNKVFDTKFKNVDWNSADIFSTWFSDCELIDINFTGSSIEDITFNNCYFASCIFMDVSIKNCIFNNCSFNDIKPSSTIFSLNNYNNCTFKDCFFRGSFEYQIFNDCTFNDTQMSASVLEYNFGFNNSNNIKYIQNNSEVNNINDMLELLISKCLDNKQFINAVLINYNFTNYINPELAIKSLMAIEQMLKEDILLSNDELVFIRKLYHYLYISKLIAPVVLYDMFETAKKIYISPIDNFAYKKCKESLYMIANSLFFDFTDFKENLMHSICQMPCYVEPAYVQIHYNKKPAESLEILLNKCIPGVIHRTKVKQGSFIECFDIGKNGLELLNIFLQLLGVAVPIIYSEIKHKKKKSKANESTALDMNIKTDTSVSKNDQEIFDLIQQTSRVVITSKVLNRNLQGYNNNNIKDIKIEYEVNIHA